MYKKTIKFISIILIALMSFSLFACKKTEEKPQTKIVVADFEDWGKNFALMRPLENFGRIEVNTDKKYIKSGEQSAKVMPLGGYSKKTIPQFYIPLASIKYDYDNTNFTRVQRITLSVYNDSDNKVPLKMGLVETIVSVDSITKIAEQNVSLEKGWNDIIYRFNREIVSISSDITSIKGIYFEFENANSRDIADAPELYFDDIVLETSSTDLEIPDIIKLKENEIADFEQSYQKYIISTLLGNPQSKPEISIVKADSVGLTAPSGEKMLQVLFNGYNAGTWGQRLLISEKIMRASTLYKLPQSKWETSYVSFDVYNASDFDLNFYPEFHTAGGGNKTQTREVRVQKHSWAQFKYKVSDIKNADIIINDLGYLALSWWWDDDLIGEIMPVYFDNFRVIQE